MASGMIGPADDSPPVVEVERLGGDAGAGLFRAADARGRVAWLARGEPFDALHVVEFAAAGDRRAFHLHRRHRERLYVFSGELRLVAERGGVLADLVLREGDLATLEPGTAHGLVALKPTLAVAFGSGADPIADTEPAPLLARWIGD